MEKKTDNMVLDESYQILTGTIPQQAKVPSRGRRWNPITCKLEDDLILPQKAMSLVIPETEDLKKEEKKEESKGGESLRI